MTTRGPILALAALPLALGLAACEKGETATPDDATENAGDAADAADVAEEADTADEDAPAGGW